MKLDNEERHRFLALVGEGVQHLAGRCLDTDDIEGYLLHLDNTVVMLIIDRTSDILKREGLLEQALVFAYRSTRTSLIDLRRMHELFRMCDRGNLRAAAAAEAGVDPGTPRTPPPWIVYRGVAGPPRTRRVRGLSWTGTLDCACWFAARFPHLPDPAVYSARMYDDDLYLYTQCRKEDEYIGRPRNSKRLQISLKEIHKRAARFARER